MEKWYLGLSVAQSSAIEALDGAEVGLMFISLALELFFQTSAGHIVVNSISVVFAPRKALASLSVW